MNDNDVNKDEFLLKRAIEMVAKNKAASTCPCPLIMGGSCPLLASAAATIKELIIKI